MVELSYAYVSLLDRLMMFLESCLWLILSIDLASGKAPDLTACLAVSTFPPRTHQAPSSSFWFTLDKVRSTTTIPHPRLEVNLSVSQQNLSFSATS